MVRLRTLTPSIVVRIHVGHPFPPSVGISRRLRRARASARRSVEPVTGRSAAGKRLAEVFPHLWQIDMPILESLPTEGIDVVLSALPHAAAAEQLIPYIRAGVPVVDASADFRLRDVEAYEKPLDAKTRFRSGKAPGMIVCASMSSRAKRARGSLWPDS